MVVDDGKGKTSWKRSNKSPTVGKEEKEARVRFLGNYRRRLKMGIHGLTGSYFGV